MTTMYDTTGGERYALQNRPQQLSFQQQLQLQRQTRPQTRPKMFMLPNRARSSSTARTTFPPNAAYHQQQQYYHTGHYSPAPLQRTVTAPEDQNWDVSPQDISNMISNQKAYQAQLQRKASQAYARIYQSANSVRGGTPSSTVSQPATSTRSHHHPLSLQHLPRPPPSTQSTPHR